MYFVFIFIFIFVLVCHDGTQSTVILNDYFGKAFKGPNSIIFDQQGTMYFTDSGPLGLLYIFVLIFFFKGKLHFLIQQGHYFLWIKKVYKRTF
jgi:hypothetical protein